MDTFYFISVGFALGFALGLFLRKPRKGIKLSEINFNNIPTPPKGNQKPNTTSSFENFTKDDKYKYSIRNK